MDELIRALAKKRDNEFVEVEMKGGARLALNKKEAQKENDEFMKPRSITEAYSEDLKPVVEETQLL